MKIMHITNNYQPYKGGVVSSIDSFIQAQQDLGHEVMLITFAFHRSLNFTHVRRIAGIKFYYKSNPMIIPFNINYFLKQYIDDFKPDIIHLHNPFLLCYAGLKLAKKLQIKTVFTHHSIYKHYLHYLPFRFDKIKEYFLNKRLKKFYKLVDHVIAPGQFIETQIKQFQPKSVSILPSPLLDVFSQSPVFNSCQGKIKLITVARLVPEKNIKYLIDVVALLKIPYEYIIIGSGMLEQDLKNYALAKNVKINFTGALPKAQIAKHYRSNNIFIFASVTETQGLVIAEALAAGRPVVALKASGVEDAVIDGYNGYLVDHQHEFCKKIELLFNDNLLYSVMQQNAYQSSLKYNKIELTKKLLSCYQ
jgi:glycosyltransferase involved in cell wall biosynthesis